MYLVDKLPLKIEKPWGWELWIAKTNHYIGKILHINPGECLSLQYHEKKDESIFVLKGILKMEIKDKDSTCEYVLKENECFRIPPKTIHRFKTENGCEIIEVSTPHPEDVVRLEDKYGRVK